jgi:D-tyrosyl-tRNA(Tyr) deacylase
MRALIQRTLNSKLYVDNCLISQISCGLTVFLGITKGDTEKQADYLAGKLAKLRVFRDENDRMNLNVLQAGGEILLVSQFSLAGKLGRGSGNRPDFGLAEAPERAKELYERIILKIREEGVTVKTGVFGAHMFIEQQQDGPLSFVFEC